MSGEAASAWLRNRGLQVLFALSFTWIVLLFFVEELFQWIPNDNYSVVLGLTVLTTVIVVCGALARFIYRRWPSFLRIPNSISILSVLARLVVCAVLIIPLLSVAFGFLAYYFWSDPENVQDLSIAYAAMAYPLIFTPALAILAAWRLSVTAAKKKPS